MGARCTFLLPPLCMVPPHTPYPAVLAVTLVTQVEGFMVRVLGFRGLGCMVEREVGQGPNSQA